jgi:SNF2 family DNA or RNA helicase
MGLRGIPNGGTGCILADEMFVKISYLRYFIDYFTDLIDTCRGLGKTLQSIALIRVLLTQSPLRQPAANKAIIVTPSSLVQNWAVEIKKWLGKTRLDPVVVGDQSAKATKDAIRMFSTSPISPLLIISYESLRSHAELLANVEFGLMICDEGHRLKNADSKTNISLMELNCSRRVVLSGTPFQNNIGEFFTLAEFVNPGVFGPPDQFRATYERPINTSRDPKCSPVEKKLGEERAAEVRAFYLPGLAWDLILITCSTVDQNYIYIYYEANK